MNAVAILSFILFSSFTIVACNSQTTENAQKVIPPESTTTVKTTPPRATGFILQKNVTETFNLDASDKIEKKIINAFAEFSSNCNINRILLSWKKFKFPNETMNLNLGIGNASFYNFIIREYDEKIRSFSTVIECSSSRKAKVEVTLPKHIVIFANVKFTDLTNTSNELDLQWGQGAYILIRLMKSSISKKFFFQVNNASHENAIRRKISYSNTEILIDKIGAKYQKLIYRNLEVFLAKVESSLGEFLVDKLNAELAKNEIAVEQSCSKFINVENNYKKIISSPLINDYYNLYVIHNVSFELDKKVSVSGNSSIVIRGFSNFSGIELYVSGTDLTIPGNDGLYRNNPGSDDPYRKEITLRIKTNDLKGRFGWNYAPGQIEYIDFSIDFILFEIQRNKTYVYSTINHDKLYGRAADNTVNIDVLSGNIVIKSSSEFGYFENHKENLLTAIEDSLKNSLSHKFEYYFSEVNC